MHQVAYQSPLVSSVFKWHIILLYNKFTLKEFYFEEYEFCKNKTPQNTTNNATTNFIVHVQVQK